MENINNDTYRTVEWISSKVEDENLDRESFDDWNKQVQSLIQDKSPQNDFDIEPLEDLYYEGYTPEDVVEELINSGEIENQTVNQLEKEEEKTTFIDEDGYEWEDKDEYNDYLEINEYYSGLGQNQGELENNGIEIQQITLDDHNQQLEIEDTLEDYIWDVDERTGEIISQTFGSVTKEVYQNLEQQGKIPRGVKGAVDMAKTARQLVNNLGKYQDSAMVAENKDYKIALEANDNLTITSRENNFDIVVVNKSQISFTYQDKDLDKFKEYSQQLAKDKDKDKEIER